MKSLHTKKSFCASAQLLCTYNYIFLNKMDWVHFCYTFVFFSVFWGLLFWWMNDWMSEEFTTITLRIFSNPPSMAAKVLKVVFKTLLILIWQKLNKTLSCFVYHLMLTMMWSFIVLICTASVSHNIQRSISPLKMLTAGYIKSYTAAVVTDVLLEQTPVCTSTTSRTVLLIIHVCCHKDGGNLWVANNIT